ncbi:MAG: adenosylcobinamide-GDP ribazoletransferase [Magnetococcales bacterium]|nr:adenosylcobinamide-GDP ribazoletransferase [Magnetococcales bacterium]
MIGRPLLLALGLLTTLPVPRVADPREREIGLSVLWYPLVGAILGVMMWGLAVCAAAWPGDLVALGILLLWLMATGGLHLEGLGDLADAWVGGLSGGPERMLAIMKDPRAGPMAVMAICMQLLCKGVAIHNLLQLHAFVVLGVAPVIGRTMMVALMLSTPYVRPEGMGAVAVRALPKNAGWWVVGVTSLAIAFLSQPSLAWSVLATGISLMTLRALILRRLHGVTGDVLGASCELSETIFLLVTVLLLF